MIFSTWTISISSSKVTSCPEDSSIHTCIRYSSTHSEGWEGFICTTSRRSPSSWTYTLPCPRTIWEARYLKRRASCTQACTYWSPCIWTRERATIIDRITCSIYYGTNSKIARLGCRLRTMTAIIATWLCTSLCSWATWSITCWPCCIGIWSSIDTALEGICSTQDCIRTSSILSEQYTCSRSIRCSGRVCYAKIPIGNYTPRIDITVTADSWVTGTYIRRFYETRYCCYTFCIWKDIPKIIGTSDCSCLCSWYCRWSTKSIRRYTCPPCCGGIPVIYRTTICTSVRIYSYNRIVSVTRATHPSLVEIYCYSWEGICIFYLPICSSDIRIFEKILEVLCEQCSFGGSTANPTDRICCRCHPWWGYLKDHADEKTDDSYTHKWEDVRVFHKEKEKYQN